MYWFTSDEHYNHKNIIKYCNRPFDSVTEMDRGLRERHNSVVNNATDVVIHAGDFTLGRERKAAEYISQLHGQHIFLKGSHDYWLPKNTCSIWEKTIDKQFVVVCHYAMRTWHRSHYNSWQLFGHSHGNLEPEGKQWDIGVDNNDFYPVCFDDLKKIMETMPDNFNLIKK